MALRVQVLGCSLFAMLLALAAPAAAQSDASTRATARQLASDGVQQFEAGNFVAASDRLERAYQILKVPSIGLWSARALAKTGKLLEANERYIEVQRLPLSGDVAVQKQAQADAQADAKQLEQRVPALTISVAGPSNPNVKVTVDGSAIPNAVLGAPWLVNPGEHLVAAQLGAQSGSVRVTILEGESKPVTVTLGSTAALAGAANPSSSPNGALPPPPANSSPADTSAAPAATAPADTHVEPVHHAAQPLGVRFGVHAGLGYVAFKADGSDATTGYEVAFGGGLRATLSDHFEIAARLGLAYVNISATGSDGTYSYSLEQEDWAVTVDGTARWLINPTTPRFYLGAGPELIFGAYSNSVAGQSVNDGKFYGVAGLFEAGLLVGHSTEWDLGLRIGRGISNCLESGCDDSLALTQVTIGAGRSF